MCWMMEGSGSGSVPQTDRSGSERPEKFRIQKTGLCFLLNWWWKCHLYSKQFTGEIVLESTQRVTVSVLSGCPQLNLASITLNQKVRRKL